MTPRAVIAPKGRRRGSRFAAALAVLMPTACSESSPPIVQEVEWRLQEEVGRGLFEQPGTPVLGFNALAAADDRIYLYDSQGAAPFYEIDTRSLEVRGFGAWGGGSGQITPGSPAVLSVTADRIFVHAILESKLLVFSRELTLLHELGPEHGLPSSGAFYAVHDTLGLFLRSDPYTRATSLARAYRIGGAEIARTELTLGDYAEGTALKPLRRNPLLNLGPVHADRAGRTFWAHYYSSFRAGFAADGAPLFLRSDPRDEPVPAAKVRRNGGVAVGDPENAVQGYVSLASDDRHLYALYSGERLTRERVMAARTGRGVEGLRLGEGRIVDVFEKADGSYRFSLTLPVWATHLAVDGGRIYALVRQDAPRLAVYEKPRILDP